MREVQQTNPSLMISKALRNEFYGILCTFFALGFPIPFILNNFLNRPCEALYVYQSPCLIAFSFPLAFFIQALLFYKEHYRGHAVLVLALLGLACAMCHAHSYTGDADNFIPASLFMLYSLWMLLNFSRSYVLALGTREAANKRFLAIECMIPLASLLGLALLLTPEKIHSHLFIPSCVLPIAVIWAFVIKSHLSLKQDPEAKCGQGAVLINKRSMGAAFIYTLLCVAMSFACVIFIKRVGRMDMLLPYAAGMAAIIIVARFLAIRLLTSSKAMSYLAFALVLGIQLAILASFAESLGLGLTPHYIILLVAFMLLAPCASFLLVGAIKGMKGWPCNITIMIWGSISLFALLAALMQLESGIPSCGHVGCSGA